MARFGDLVFDCDNHYYEAPDAFTRHVPPAMHGRCVQWVDMDGRKYHLVGGRLSHAVKNPTWNPIVKPGALHEYFRGNPRELSVRDLLSAREPRPPEYMDRDARVAKMDEQGVEAVWLFPTLGVLYEEPIKDDTEAVRALFTGFNRWLEEDWGCNYRDRIFAAPYVSLTDVDWACAELEWALERDARVVVMRPAAVSTPGGQRSPCDEMFDSFWSRVNDAGITVVIHAGDSGYSCNGYASDMFSAGSTSMSYRPSVKGFALERAAYDFLITMVYEKMFERFPNLRVASVENGSEFLPDLFRKVEHSKARSPFHYGEDPTALFREHVWINPFWEDDVNEIVEYMGAERVIFGSDWPHMEGLPQPRDYIGEVEQFDDDAQRCILRDNTRGLNVRRPS